MTKKNTAFFQGSIQIDDYHVPLKDTPFVESNSCPCDFPAQINVIVFSFAIFSQISTQTVTSVITQPCSAGQLIFNFSKCCHNKEIVCYHQSPRAVNWWQIESEVVWVEMKPPSITSSNQCNEN